MSTVAPLASRPDVRAAVTGGVTDAIMSEVDLDALLAGVAPNHRADLEAVLGALGGPITGGVKDFVHGTVVGFVAGDAFLAIWTQLNRQAHAAVVGALTGDQGHVVRLRGDAVVLDLTPVVAQVEQRLVARGLTAASRIPPVHADFTLVRSQDVRKARAWFRALRVAGNWLPAVTVVLAAAGSAGGRATAAGAGRRGAGRRGGCRRARDRVGAVPGRICR
ncbi:hypothetical protein [Actinacidiphila sp. ITFR-21]|uniref:hypothetical protein n=1 Tax=Actinacidiphila sp. ITFR-21 TaxID=3075199 RepID=UPI0028891831|nr:hypothetical protein [Streptomyces sp. ITFR-21]WNI15909.1 hypothetical protein RLT57_10515 [Streptomyces sp. ITFR-21]